MKQEEKKINVALDINKELQKQIASSTMVKFILYGSTIVGGILAIGFLAKVFNFTLINVKQLKNTIKQ